MKNYTPTNRHSVSRLLNLTYLPRWAVLLLDSFLVVIAFVIGSWLGGYLFIKANQVTHFPLWEQLGILLLVQTGFFICFHTYASILRYSTFVDIIKAGISIGLTGAVLILINAIAKSFDVNIFYNSILITYVFVAIVFLIAERVGIKTVFEFLARQHSRIPVMIYGVKSAGLAIGKMLQTTPDSKYCLQGFITDDKNDVSHNLQGLRVLYKDESLIRFMRQRNIRHVIVSPSKLKEINPAADLSIFLDNEIRLLKAPIIDWDVAEGKSHKFQMNSIERIRVEDLLERPVINIDTDAIIEMMKDKVIMITGAAGSIGSEIVRQVSQYKPSLVVLFEIAESPLHDLSMDLQTQFPNQPYARCIGDVRNLKQVESIISEYKPSIIFHAAAYKHVPLMEEFPPQAVLANVLGTRNVADMAIKYGVKKFVMISTDKAVNPTNVMGASKRIAESYVQALNNCQEKNTTTKFITTRFGNVLGSNGSVVPYFKKQIAVGGPVTVTHPDIIRYFMTIPEASSLVLEAATLGKGGEIFCFDMGEPVKIADLAKNMIRLAGFTPGIDIKIQYTGLRPGEKLYEELLNQRETTLPTPNKKIKIAKVREVDYNTLIPNIDVLIQEAEAGKDFPTVALMKKIVPEFKSRNSIYEQLD